MRTFAAPGFPSLLGLLAHRVAMFQAEDPFRPVLVVTAGDLARAETRRFLARRLAGTIAVEVRTLPGWVSALAADELARTASTRLGEPAFERLVAREVEERSRSPRRGDPLRSISGTPGFATALAASLRDLAEGRIGPDFLARALPSGDRLRGELVRVSRAVGERAVELSLSDRRTEERLAASALATASEGPATFLFGFHDLTALQRDLVRSATGRGPVALFVPGPGGPGEAAASGLLEWAGSLGTVEFFEEEPPEPTAPVRLTLEAGLFEEAKLADPGPERVRLATYPTEAAEVRGIARAIRRAVLHEDRAFDDFLVTIGSSGPPPALFRRIFARAGVPLADRVGVSARATSAGRRTVALARALGTPDPIRDAAALPFVGSDPALGEPTREPAAERPRRPVAPEAAFGPEAPVAPVAREAPAETFADLPLFAIRSSSATDIAPAADATDPTVSALAQSPPRIPFPSTPEPLSTECTWTEAIATLRAVHEEWFGHALPEEIDEPLASLAAIEGSAPFAREEFPRIVGSVLDSVTLRDPPEDEDGARVLLVRLDAARGLARPIVFHAGLVEGSVRRSPREDLFLPDRLRERISERHEHEGRFLPRRLEARVERVLLARFAFETSTERAVLSWAERERAGTAARNPSGLLLELAARRAGGPLEPHTPEFRRVAAREDPDEAAHEPVDRTDLSLSLFARAGEPPRDALARIAGRPGAEFLGEALAAAEERWRPDELGPFDGALADPETIEAVWERVDPDRKPWSPTALEALASCPFSFLVQHVLRLDSRPDEDDDFDPSERGTVFHRIHEALGRELSRSGRLPLTREHLPGAIEVLDRIVAREGHGLQGETPLRRAHRRATLGALRDDVAAFLAREAARRGPTPEHFELKFGFSNDAGEAPPAFDLGSGRSIPLRGKIDRVDRREDGGVEVVDLKTGAPRGRSGSLVVSRGGQTDALLQAPLYLEAAEQVLGTAAERAILLHATIEHGFREVELTDADRGRARGELGSLLAHLLDCARDGFFPCRPGETCCRTRLAAACGPAASARFARKTGVSRLLEHERRLAALEPPHPERTER